MAANECAYGWYGGFAASRTYMVRLTSPSHLARTQSVPYDCFVALPPPTIPLAAYVERGTRLPIKPNAGLLMMIMMMMPLSARAFRYLDVVLEINKIAFPTARSSGGHVVMGPSY